ncbi:MAG TPA: endolytic transglycosylase MltG [Hyphomicrobiaceae bacterium]|jgi:UPF0755 protein|nr:endolytic transglycosylase MltG [Hyphomicrobiaceae bacterium]
MARLGPALRFLNGVLTLSFFVLGLGWVATFWIGIELDKPGPLREAKTIVVRKGEGAHEIARKLEAEGVISSQHVFIAHYVARHLASWSGGKPLQLKAGEYELQPGMSMRLIAETLGDGKSLLYRVTIPEGLTSHEIVERLKADPNLIGEVVSVPAEGSMLPDTYRFSRGMTRQGLIELMQEESGKFLQKVWADRQTDLPFSTPEQALVLASIVEKETGRHDERGRVAAVFINRLRQGMRLQSDPTILYGLSSGQAAWGRPIYRNEIQQKTTHNTYQIDGLPPTPICNPGRAAIGAAVNPAQTADLYFVADGTGGHVFSQTLKEHNAAVVNWRKVEKELRARQIEAAARAASPSASDNTAAPTGTASEAQAAAAPLVSPDVPVADGPTADGKTRADSERPADSGPAAGTAATRSDAPPPVRKAKR